jgi:hypothetical protein
VPSRTPSSSAAAAAGQNIRESFGTLRALLRLIDPDSPFQPILLSTVDIVSWLALFGKAAERLGQSIHGMPPVSGWDAVCDTTQPLLRLANALCVDAEPHAFPQTEPASYDVPEIPPFCPSSAMTAEDAEAISKAADKASRVFEASVKHRSLLCRTLSLAAEHLRKKLDGPDGSLRVLRARCRTARPFKRQFHSLVQQLTAALNDLPDPAAEAWEKCRIKFATVRYLMVTELLPSMDTIVAGLDTDTRLTNSQKATIVQVVTAFLEARGLAMSLDAGLMATQYHTLFRDILSQVNTAISRCGSREAKPSKKPRLIDDLRQLSPEVIKRDHRSSWDTTFPDTDTYTVAVVLAALHHLERPTQESAGIPGRDTRIFGTSDADLARWLRQGRYAGADPSAERSNTLAAETKRVGRTLQHLRRVGGCFSRSPTMDTDAFSQCRLDPASSVDRQSALGNSSPNRRKA